MEQCSNNQQQRAMSYTLHRMAKIPVGRVEPHTCNPAIPKRDKRVPARDAYKLPFSVSERDSFYHIFIATYLDIISY